MDTCSHCGVELPEKATFCPACGRRTDAPPPDPSVLPIVLQVDEPRYFGLASPPVILAIAAGIGVLGIVLIVIGALIPGVIAIVAGACLLPAFFAGARRWPSKNSAVVRASVNTADRVRGEGAVAVESISTWSKTGRDLVRHRKRQFGLRRERDAKIRELGVAAYAEDGRADELKAAAKELDEQIEANERTMERKLAEARKRVRKERDAVVATQVIEPEPDADETKEKN